MFLDLHIHTTASDGTFSPAQVVEDATSKGIRVISITDHDNIGAYGETLEVSESCILIPGVEISAEFSKGTLHILGYGIDLQNHKLRSTLDELQQFRLHRNRKMLDNMKALGWDISMEEILEEARGEVIGRPHFASLMFKKGYVDSYQEAFDRYLKKGAPLYLDKKRLSPEDSIQLILQAGGIPVMAHPYQTKREGPELEELVRELHDMGLKGIEAFYSLHNEQMTAEYLDFAEKSGLLVTAGSDFHGSHKPEISLGMEISEEYIFPTFRELMDRGTMEDAQKEKLSDLVLGGA